MKNFIIGHLFWLGFLAIVAALLAGASLWVYGQFQNNGIQSLIPAARFLPISPENRSDIEALLTVAASLLKHDGRERTFLLLFQNNWELRPGGGFIGSYGILKLKNGALTTLTIADTYHLDKRLQVLVEPPYPLKETLRITHWNLRDSNFSPDFTVNAREAEYFYRQAGGIEQLDGVIAITTTVLTRLLKVTGPITLAGYPGTYAAEDAIYNLEYQVEKGYADQGIPREERKSILNPLAEAVLSKMGHITIGTVRSLGQILLESLKQKDMQLMFHDQSLQRIARARGWSGSVDQKWQDDYLMVVDANVGSAKTDYLLDRAIHYTVDFSGPKPHAALRITYRHKAQKPTWLVNRYRTYMRVYVPQGAEFTHGENLGQPLFLTDLGKQVFASLIEVQLGEEKTVALEYDLPVSIAYHRYQLKIQKQAGLHNVPVTVVIKDNDAKEEKSALILNADSLLTF